MSDQINNWNTLKSCFQGVFGNNADYPSKDCLLIDIPDWESIRFIQLLISIEKNLSISFDASEITLLNTWGDLEEGVNEKLKRHRKSY